MKKEAKELKLQEATKDLYDALLLLDNSKEMSRFFNDLCTPQEIKEFAERWRVCKLLDQGTLSYREIHSLTGASLATIGRVSRFLKTEPHRGYRLVLDRLHRKEK